MKCCTSMSQILTPAGPCVMTRPSMYLLRQSRLQSALPEACRGQVATHYFVTMPKWGFSMGAAFSCCSSIWTCTMADVVGCCPPPKALRMAANMSFQNRCFCKDSGLELGAGVPSRVKVLVRSWLTTRWMREPGSLLVLPETSRQMTWRLGR